MAPSIKTGCFTASMIRFIAADEAARFGRRDNAHVCALAAEVFDKDCKVGRKRESKRAVRQAGGRLERAE